MDAEGDEGKDYRKQSTCSDDDCINAFVGCRPPLPLLPLKKGPLPAEDHAVHLYTAVRKSRVDVTMHIDMHEDSKQRTGDLNVTDVGVCRGRAGRSVSEHQITEKGQDDETTSDQDAEEGTKRNQETQGRQVGTRTRKGRKGQQGGTKKDGTTTGNLEVTQPTYSICS